MEPRTERFKSLIQNWVEEVDKRRTKKQGRHRVRAPLLSEVSFPEGYSGMVRSFGGANVRGDDPNGSESEPLTISLKSPLNDTMLSLGFGISS